MIVGIGTGILTIERLKYLEDDWSNPFLTHSFTQAEQAEALRRAAPLRYFAGRFAAKEAIRNALQEPVGAVSFAQIEVLADASGKPTAHLIGAPVLAETHPEAHPHILVSISHETELVIAAALVLC
jgi:holo-[acyl-carrier protein] synthase